MLTLKRLLLRVNENLFVLQEREAKYGGSAPLDLLNQINDHQTAIELIEDALSVELSERDFERLKEELRPLLIAGNVEQISVDDLKPEKPLLPCEPETVHIPAGVFLMGSNSGEAEEAPQHEVKLPAYRISKYPVTNAQYAEFIRQNRKQATPKKAGWKIRKPPSNKLDHPVVGVSWHDALAYCTWLSALTERAYRLPTEAEWEKAASWADAGDPKRQYPWGDQFLPENCNAAETGLGQTTPVFHFSPQGNSACGCADMAGNVQEWTSTLWGMDVKTSDFPYPYRPNDGREDNMVDSRVFRVYRSGSFRDTAFRLRCSTRGWSDPDSKLKWRGFRVVLTE